MARLSDEKNLDACSKSKLQVERNKIDVVQMFNRPPKWYWHNDVSNDFCVFTEVCEPTAAYLYVIREGNSLKPTLVVTDGWDVKERRDPQLLDASLEDNEIADRLIELVLNASREAISERHLHCLAIS